MAAQGTGSSSSAVRLVRDQRHRAWMERYTGGVRTGSWRPQVFHRKSAKKWLLMTDNQMKVSISTVPAGWAFFQPNPELPCWQHWSTWPWIGVSRDLGSDGLAASMALLYKYKVNTTFFDDFSHGANCDLKVCLKAVGLFQFWLLMFCS